MSMTASKSDRDCWDDASFVVASQYRVTVMKQLNENPATPSKIVERDSDISIDNASHTLRQLSELGLVELLVPEERRKGRVYGLTEQGGEVYEHIVENDLA